MSRPDKRFFTLFATIPEITFFETGTYKGAGVREALDVGFKKAVSIEAVESLYQGCKDLFKGEIAQGSVALYCGGSEKMLPAVAKDISTPILFWLDAHFQGLEAEFSAKNCPLNDEVAYICELRKKSPLDIILIDDVRLLKRKSSWKGHDVVFERIIGKLQLAYPDHFSCFLNGFQENDVFALVPDAYAERFVAIRTEVEKPEAVSAAKAGDVPLDRENTTAAPNGTSSPKTVIAAGNGTAVRSNKIVLVKGKYGMGGRMTVLASAMKFAQETNRRLIVDWNDGYYDDKKDEFDVYTHYVTAPASDAVKFYREYPVATASVYPPAWAAKPLGLSLNPYEDVELYRVAPPDQDVEEDVVVVTGPSKIKRQDVEAQMQKVKFAPRIHEKAEAFFGETFTQLPIGVHVRHGNGENGVIVPKVEWFVQTIKEIRAEEHRPVFLATDSKLVVDYFKRELDDVFIFEKEYSLKGPLHNNLKRIQDPYLAGDAALVDVMILSKCPIMVVTGHYFGQLAMLLGGGSREVLKYPERVRFGSDAPGVPITSRNALCQFLVKNDIRLDSLRIAATPGKVDLFYGYDPLLTADSESNISPADLRDRLLKRRLYA